MGARGPRCRHYRHLDFSRCPCGVCGKLDGSSDARTPSVYLAWWHSSHCSASTSLVCGSFRLRVLVSHETMKVHRIYTHGTNIQRHFRTSMRCPYNVSPEIIILWTSMRYHCKYVVITSLGDVFRMSSHLHFSWYWEFAFIAMNPGSTAILKRVYRPPPSPPFCLPHNETVSFVCFWVIYRSNQERADIWSPIQDMRIRKFYSVFLDTKYFYSEWWDLIFNRFLI